MRPAGLPNVGKLDDSPDKRISIKSSQQVLQKGITLTKLGAIDEEGKSVEPDSAIFEKKDKPRRHTLMRMSSGEFA